jgi:hypothetical protein
MDSVSVQSMHLAVVALSNVSLYRVDDAMDKSVAVLAPLAILDDTGVRYFYVTGPLPLTVTLPATAACHVDDEFTVKDMTGTASPLTPLTLAAAGADLIDGAASFSIATMYGAAHVKYTGIAGREWAVI